MYNTPSYTKTSITTIPPLEGETIETKVERIVSNKEPIKDGAHKMIYTERKDGIIAAYNIRTDRFEVACEAMDKVQASIQAKREERAKPKTKVIDINDGGAEPIQATSGSQ